MTWPITSQSKSMRSAARRCLTVGRELRLSPGLHEGGHVHRLHLGELAEAQLGVGRNWRTAS